MNSARRVLTVLALTICIASLPRGQAPAADWPQFRGPARDGTAASFAAPAAWPERLTERWRVEVGEGYAAPLLIGDRVYVFARRGGQEVMHALDAASGQAVWQTAYDAPVTVVPAAKAHGPGPKSTPAFGDGRLFSLGMGGIVTAFDASGGRLLWQKPAGPVLPLYGTATSPLVDRGLVVVHVGGHDAGALTAFDAGTGDERWRWDGDGPSYASPIVAEIAGARQVIALTQDNLVGVSVDTGALLWRRPFATEYTQNIITPLLVEDTIIVAGYQRPTEALRIVRDGPAGAWRTERVWENEQASFYMADPVIVGDTLFGLSHRNSGQYVLLDVKTGRTLWTGPPRQAENAAIVGAGDVVLSLQDDGQLIAGRVGTAGFDELKRYEVTTADAWTPPVVSGARIFVKDTSALTLWSAP